MAPVARGSIHEGMAKKYLLDQGIKSRIEGYVQKIVMQQPEDALLELYKLVGDDIALRDSAIAAPKDVGELNELMDEGQSLQGSRITASVHGLVMIQKPDSLGGERVQVPFTRMAADHHATPVLMESWCRDMADAMRMHLNPKFAAGKMATKAVFNEIDTDGDGSLTMLELYDYLSKKGPIDKAMFEEGFKQLDINGDGKVSLAEFEHHLGIRELPTQVVHVVSHDPMEEQILQEQAALEEEIAAHEEVEQLFDEIDADASGTLEFDEVWRDLQARNSGITLEQAQELFASIDLDGDGVITLEEFKEHMGLNPFPGMGNLGADESADEAQIVAEIEAEAAFDTIDQDQKGFFTLNDLWDDLELKGYEVTREQVEEMFASMDVNGDGLVSMAEFKAAMGLPDDLIAEAQVIEEMHIQAEEVFDTIDADMSGTLEFEELWEYLNQHGASLSKEEAIEKFKALDENGDGKVSLEEFKKYLQLPDEIPPEAIPIGDAPGDAMAEAEMLEEEAHVEVEAEFDQIDVDGSGFLDFDEIWADLEQKTGVAISRDAALEVFKSIDLNGDGKVSMSEFKIAMGLMPTQEDVEQELHEAAEIDFDIIDKDGSGYIEFDELWADLEQRMGGRVSQEVARGMFDELDVNGDGKVSIVEFKMKLGLRPKMEEVMEEVHADVENEFDQIDADGSGYLEFEEIWADLEQKLGQSIDREQAESIFKELDVNGDGKVSLVEFKMKVGVMPTRQEIVEEAHNEAEEAFDAIDTDGSGYLDLEELWADLQKRGMVELTREQVEEIFKSIDANGDGKVSLAEFKSHMGIPLREYEVIEQMHEDAEAAFAAIDTDKSGSLSLEEIGAELKRRGLEVDDESVKKIFDSLDVNGDGQVSMSEFKASLGLAGFDIQPFESDEFAITGGPVPQTDAMGIGPPGDGDDAAQEAPRGEAPAEEGEAAAPPPAEEAPAAEEGGEDPAGGEEDAYVHAPHGLFPSPFAAEGEGCSKVLSHFAFLGRLMGKALLDQRPVDLPLSLPFFKRMVGVGLCADDIALIDPPLHTALRNMRALAARHAEAAAGGGEEGALEGELLLDGCRVSDLCLDFTMPGKPDVELVPGGRDRAVTLSNLGEYADCVTNMTLVGGVHRQFAAFEGGFNEVFPMRHLRVFSPEELEHHIRGDMEAWNAEMLRSSIKPDHGFHEQSLPILWLVQIMSDMDRKERRLFMRFITGSPTLPAGGLRKLNPRLTVVRKEAEAPLTPDDYLPSVMTCANYLKLPDYS
eukprot:CAMPEP_0114133154 /NCGR_PEP_ID=MMETSP0043_2-20121206/13474_1 /TAXON_ID=464988 /ORGANISM="Hemiselmis andersenii, Strain CCMP644" /LENGTH=1256 /DNA_ID=CAMNT_0001226711 /DNA_START=123 /DNA_END=3890 /DNA_ORIENTATION=-